MKLLLIRHGEPDYATDTLTGTGVREARHLNGIFAGFGHVTDEGLEVIDEIVRRVKPMDEEIGVVRWQDRPIIDTIVIEEE